MPVPILVKKVILILLDKLLNTFFSYIISYPSCHMWLVLQIFYFIRCYRHVLKPYFCLSWWYLGTLNCLLPQRQAQVHHTADSYLFPQGKWHCLHVFDPVSFDASEYTCVLFPDVKHLIVSNREKQLDPNILSAVPELFFSAEFSQRAKGRNSCT